MTHPLQLFLDETGETLEAFARRAVVSPMILASVIEDEEGLDPGAARRIAAATGGAISSEQLMSARASVIADLKARTIADTALDLSRLVQAIATALPCPRLVGMPTVPEFDLEIAAEATAHTYAALAPVTTLAGPARLAQALRPVLEEILRDHGALPSDLQVLDEAALSASLHYYRT